MTVQNIQPPYTKTILDVEAAVTSQSAIVYLGTLPIRISVQANLADAAITVGAFDDGTKAQGTATIVTAASLGGKTVTVAGHVLTEGVDWNKTDGNNNATATSLASAIDALSEVSATAASAIVTIKAATVGTAGNAITLVTNGAAALTVSGALLTGGTASDINDAANTIAITAHGYATGLKVNFDKLTGTVPTGLSDNTDYYVIATDVDTVKLATTELNALAGIAIDITGAAAGGGTFTLTPSAMDVDFTTYGSNDGENFVQLDTVTVSSDSSKLFQYPTPTYSFLKVTVDPGDSEVDAEVIIHTKL